MMATTEISDDLNGLILTLASSLACILGSLVICSDVVWRCVFPTSKFDLNNNQAFLVCSLALSSGVLIYTSMYKLLPEGLEYYRKSSLIGNSPQNAQALLIITFILGVSVCAVINTIIHAFTSQSVVHCVHDDETHTHSDNALNSNRTPHHNHNTHQQVPAPKNMVEVDERADPLSLSSSCSSYKKPQYPPVSETGIPQLREYRSVSDLDNIRYKQPTSDFADWKLHGKTSITKDINSSEMEYYLDTDQLVNENTPNIQQGSRQTLMVTNENSPLLSHQVTPYNYDVNAVSFEANDDDEENDKRALPEYSRLFSIGLQTAIAISVHKVPEGFLTFATSHANRELGFSVFVALAIHNISEGFTIAFPLFLALGSRGVAILAAFALGGLSQPFGAFLAWLFFNSGIVPGSGSSSGLDDKTQLVFGIIVSITAGFLSMIGFQMYGTAVSFGGKQSTTLACVFIGVTVVGLGSSLTVHD